MNKIIEKVKWYDPSRNYLVAILILLTIHLMLNQLSVISFLSLLDSGVDVSLAVILVLSFVLLLRRGGKNHWTSS